MQIDIEGKLGRPIPREHVRARLADVLDRPGIRPVRTRVTFTDVNGPKGGDDVRCALLLELPRQPSIRIARRGTTPRRAFDEAYDRLVRRLEERLERGRDLRRRPKKYYVARRLLE